MHKDLGYDNKAKETGSLEAHRDRWSRPQTVAHVNNNMTLPITISQASISPTSSVRCRICSKEFLEVGKMLSLVQSAI